MDTINIFEIFSLAFALLHMQLPYPWFLSAFLTVIS